MMTRENELLENLEKQKKTAIEESGKQYDDMIAKSESFYEERADELGRFAEEQKAMQQAQTDFTIQQIERQKEEAREDFVKERSGAYADWQKQSDKYGVNAERMASGGMTDSGYSESSEVRIYNAYQSRVTAAKESFDRAVLHYDNAIKEAQLSNSVALAEIAFNTLEQELAFLVESFQYKNALLTQKISDKLAIESEYNALFSELLSRQGQSVIEKDEDKDDGEAYDSEINNTLPTGNEQVANPKDDLLYLAQANIFYTDAAVEQFIRQHGIPECELALVSSKEWYKGKKKGYQGDAYKYSTYNEYAKNYLKYRISKT